LDQLNEVITRQKNTHLYIGEALVQIGAISSEKLQQYLEEFKADQAQYVSDRIELPVGIDNSLIWEMTADLTYKMITRILDMQFRPGKCQKISNIDSNYMMAAMDLSGDVESRYIISVSEAVQKVVAKAILHEESVDTEPAEVLEDTVMEFVNVVCGNVAAKTSQMGKIMNINPPVTIHPPASGLPVPAGHIGLCFPIYVGENDKMELILFIKL
jgi:CheY-specific phosphatase CheX